MGKDRRVPRPLPWPAWREKWSASMMHIDGELNGSGSSDRLASLPMEFMEEDAVVKEAGKE